MKPLLSLPHFFNAAWSRYTAHLSTYTILTLILVVPNMIVQSLTWSVLKEGTTPFVMVDIFGTLAVFLCGLAASVSLLYAAADNAEQPWRVYYRKNFKSWKPYLYTNLLRGLLIFAGLVMLVIPGLIASVQFIIAEWIAVLEGKSSIDAIRASRERVRGRGWATAGRIIAMSLCVGVFSFVVTFILAFFSIPDFVIDSVVLLFVMPLSMILSYVLYRNLTETFVPTIHPTHA